MSLMRRLSGGRQEPCQEVRKKSLGTWLQDVAACAVQVYTSLNIVCTQFYVISLLCNSFEETETVFNIAKKKEKV